MPRFLTPFIMLCLVGFSARLGYQMARPPVLPRFAGELGAEAWLIGLIVGASTMTGVFIKFPAGALSDILGRRRMLLLGAAFFAFPPFLYLLVQEAYTLLGLRFLHGFATAIFSPVASAAVADLFHEGRGAKLGWFGSANEFESAFGPLFGGFALGALAGPGLSKFYITYLSVGILGVVTFLLALRLPIGQTNLRPASTAPSEAPEVSRWKQFLQGMREVVGTFLKIGALSYGGAASIGIMQTEVMEKRAWIPREQLIEGMALVSTLAGPGGVQLGIFLGHTRAGWWGGVLAGLCFILPAFCILLALTLIYHHYDALPRIRHLFYGLSPVVIGIFTMSVYRLGRSAVRDWTQILLAIGVALAVGLTPLGIVPTLLLAGTAGVVLYGSRTWGSVAAVVIVMLYGAYHWGSAWLTMPAFSSTDLDRTAASLSPALWDIGLFFLKVGAFTFGGGLTILAFMQDQVVNHLHWLTPQQFLDGLALGQLTPGPIVMLAAFVGYEVGAIWGAVVAAATVYLPSFILMLAVLPVMERIKRLAWMKAALQGISPAVIGMTAVAVIRMLPYAISGMLTGLLTVGTVAVMGLWRLSPLPLMTGGAAIGLVLRARLA
jgi:chromate transporter